MRLIDGANARISVIICIHTEAKWLIIPYWRRLPMSAVVTAKTTTQN